MNFSFFWIRSWFVRSLIQCSFKCLFASPITQFSSEHSQQLNDSWVHLCHTIIVAQLMRELKKHLNASWAHCHHTFCGVVSKMDGWTGLHLTDTSQFSATFYSCPLLREGSKGKTDLIHASRFSTAFCSHLLLPAGSESHGWNGLHLIDTSQFSAAFCCLLWKLQQLSQKNSEDI